MVGHATKARGYQRIASFFLSSPFVLIAIVVATCAIVGSAAILAVFSKREPCLLEGQNLEAFFSGVNAIVSALTLLVILGGGIFALHQLKEMEQARHFTVLSALLSKLTSRKSVNARRLLYQKYSEDPEQFKKPFFELPKNLQDACDRVRYDFSELGLFVHTHLKGQSIGKELFHVVPAKMWIILEHYVRTTEGTQGIGFKYMAKLGIDYWFETRLPGTRSLVIKSYVDPLTPREILN